MKVKFQPRFFARWKVDVKAGVTGFRDNLPLLQPEGDANRQIAAVSVNAYRSGILKLLRFFVLRLYAVQEHLTLKTTYPL